MKCRKCGETISKSLNKCPNCGTLISDSYGIDHTKTEKDAQEFQLLEDEEIILPDTDFKATKSANTQDATEVHENPWDEKDFSLITDNENGSSETEPNNSNSSSTDRESSLEETRYLEYHNKIKSIPPDEYEIICKGIKETFVTDEDISIASLNALHYHKFTEFEIHKLIIHLYEEMEESGLIQNDTKPDWLLDNTADNHLASLYRQSETEEEEESVVEELLSSDAPEELLSSDAPEEILSSDAPEVKKKKKESREAIECWKEYEQEATHSATKNVTLQSRGNELLNKRSRILYANLHPKRHKGKIAMVLVLSMLFILLYPSLESVISSYTRVEKSATEISTQGDTDSTTMKPTSAEVTTVTQSDEQSTLLNSNDTDYSEYFDLFDSTISTDKEEKTSSVSEVIDTSEE